MTDPYEAQGSNLRVHHPVQPKTQVEKWEEEVKENQRIITECACGGECPKKGTDNCRDRISKIYQLYELISQATQPIHPRYQTGTFMDDEVVNHCSDCGSKMVSSLVRADKAMIPHWDGMGVTEYPLASRYNKETGKEQFTTLWKCPKKKWWNNHDVYFKEDIITR